MYTRIFNNKIHYPKNYNSVFDITNLKYIRNILYAHIKYCVTIKKATVFFIHHFKVTTMRPNTINVLDLLSNKNVTFYIPPYQ